MSVKDKEDDDTKEVAQRFISIQKINLKKLAQDHAHGNFDVIVMDPQWDSKTLPIKELESLDIPALQQTGYLFLWTDNDHLMTASLDIPKRWGYKLVTSGDVILTFLCCCCCC